MEQIKKYFQKDKFAKFNGIEILEIKKGWAKVKMDITENHLNGVGIVHGGAIFTLADMAFAAAANSHENISVGINATISYMNAGRGKILLAEAQEVSRNPKLSSYTVRITDEKDDLVAIFQGMAYIKREKIDFL
ncbi:MAG: hotdog fold thioesterase [Methanobacteriaceae archaeon]|nr:hotdog fold thioesterase [Methanobacteriaceae archaeon]MDO9627113.1 hotdog fold thioesterase [Methanobacteriaceae archaeon]